MKGFKPSEWSIWNTLQHQHTHQRHFTDIPTPAVTTTPTPAVIMSSTLYESEKQPFLEQTPDIEQAGGAPRRRSLYRWLSPAALLFVLCVCVPWAMSLMGPCGAAHRALVAATREVFEVARPVPNYGTRVHSQPLLTFSFGQSWGQPAVRAYAPPPVAFNKVILELTTTLEGAQHDRLINVFLDGVSLWRSSSVESTGGAARSVAHKDVSVYASVLAAPGEVMVQLDNMLSARLDGAIGVNLTAHYYFQEPRAAPDFYHSLFSLNRAADHVLPMVAHGSQPPILILPSRRLLHRVPPVRANTTRARLSVFISGNAAEEFWYGNVADRATRAFAPGKILPGHGPVRLVAVYANGVRVAVASPAHTVYTGGISPELWNPVVSRGTFDVRSIDVDLTPLLPLLWKEGAELEVRVVNDSGTEAVGENWIASANLLTWESSAVRSTAGRLHRPKKGASKASVEVEQTTTTLNQTASAAFSNELKSDLVFGLTNGTHVHLRVVTSTKAQQSNGQSYRALGEYQRVVSELTNSRTFTMTLKGEKHPLYSSRVNHRSMLEALVDVLRRDGRSSTYDATIGLSSLETVYLNGAPAMVEEASQNGTSRYSLSNKANHGFGSLTLSLHSQAFAPFPKTEFSRVVEVVNGTITTDTAPHLLFGVEM